jgi:uncharacterized protein
MSVGVERHAVDVPGGRLALALHLPATDPAPCVLACHGLGASKDSDKYLLMAEEFPRAGIALARFDFRGCGESTGLEEETTIETRIVDARSALALLARHVSLTGRFGLLGSSLGGFVALWIASQRGDAPPVVTWNAPSDLRDLPAGTDRTGLGAAFFAEVATGRFARAPARVPRHLVIVSDLDEIVPPVHADALHSRAAEPRALVTIAGADHRLTEIGHRRQALALSLDWFREHLTVRSTDTRPLASRTVE